MRITQRISNLQEAVSDSDIIITITPSHTPLIQKEWVKPGTHFSCIGADMAGMEIKDIRQFMDWCVEGPATYPQRKAMFEAQRVHMEAELEQMNRTLDMLKFKCWYYEQAIKDGSEDRLKALIPDHLPEGIQKAYENAHS